jgi:hypothetical protein
VRARGAQLEAFQTLLRAEGIELRWPALSPL